MKIFLSYAAEDRTLIEPIYYALVKNHTVFFDRKSLPGGDDFDERIRKAIRRSDLMVFCITPNSTDQGSYSLTELKFAEKKWIHPKGHVLPIMAKKTSYDAIPSYLKAVTVLEAAGNLAAEAAARINAIGKRRRMRKIILSACVVALVIIASVVGREWRDGNPVNSQTSNRQSGKNSPSQDVKATPKKLPAPLNIIVATDDKADQIQIKTTPREGTAGRMQVCLQVQTQSGWWKGIGLNERSPTLEGERHDGLKCTTISPGRIDIAYWKAKVFGVHTYVGTRTLDLRPYKDHEVMFTWKKD